MRKAIGKKSYDTARAKLVCKFESDLGKYDLEFEITELYRTARGAWFVAGTGGPASRWAVESGRGSWRGGSGLLPITSEEAREFLEQHAAAALVEEYFELEEA